MEGNSQDLKPDQIVWYKMRDNEDEVRFLRVKINSIVWDNSGVKFNIHDVTDGYKSDFSVDEKVLSANSWKSFV